MKRLANGRYQVRWRDRRGEQRAKNFRTKERAQRFLRDLDSGVFDDSKENPTFRQFVERWLRDHALIAKSATTVAEDRKALDMHILPVLGDRRMRALSKLDYVQLRSHLAAKPKTLNGKPLSPKTVNNHLTLTKTIVGAAYEWDVISKNPFRGQAGLPLHERELKYWTIEQRDRFVGLCVNDDPAFAELVFVATATGLRFGELWALQRSQLDLEHRQIRVDATYSRSLRRRLPRTKNKAVGYVPMADIVVQLLRTREHLQPNAPVFDQEMFLHAGRKLRRLSKAYGVPVIRFHDLRHTFASVLVMAGQPLYTVQKLMRHKTGAMTERYSHLAPQYLASAIEAVSARKVHCEREGETNRLILLG